MFIKQPLTTPFCFRPHHCHDGKQVRLSPGGVCRRDRGGIVARRIHPGGVDAEFYCPLRSMCWYVESMVTLIFAFICYLTRSCIYFN